MKTKEKLNIKSKLKFENLKSDYNVNLNRVGK